MERLDVIVHGSTGYTGQLVARYLATAKSSAQVTWGISGRSKERLEQLAVECAAKDSSRKQQKPAIFVADSLSASDVETVAKRARVIIACAGPFTKYGMPMAEACIAAGTHYVDITGEFPFVRELASKCHDAAKSKNLYFLPCSGFDSVPSDVMNALVHNVGESGMITIRRVECAFQIKAGGASRGTLDSILHIKNTMQKADRSPVSLNAPEHRKGLLTPRVVFPGWNAGLGSWVGPFMMAASNERIVRRSNSLSSSATRQQAAYSEMIRGSLANIVVNFAVMCSLVLLFVPGLSGLIQRYLFPAARQGPKGDGHFTVRAAGYVSDKAAQPAVLARMACDIEPYKFTAVSAAESALALAAGEFDKGTTGGVVTAGYAVSESLQRRLEQSGHVTFSIDRSPK
eukprot:CAMPEP_0174835672 /NCGR_PEP_ID=MMETSP1114-20130205/5527_1 /TAXON_ID=312471 /ORGANISM="Neobodo designis, Strain CCAP 1951/1" /LENGTH=400 /DNA_ID=CAMNT_0016069625 /DNA_START=42 /DNA_END=1244 /DNA_ORIENTATION=-